MIQGLKVAPCIQQNVIDMSDSLEDYSLGHSLSHSSELPILNSITHKTTLSSPHLHKKERKNIYSFFLNLDENDLKFQFPELKKLGFGIKQLHEIVEGLKKFEKPLDYLLQGLEHAEAAVENNLLNDMAKSEVKDPLGYIFASLRKHGTFDRPPGWVSPEQRAIDEANKRIEIEKQRLALVEELEAISKKANFLEKFRAWKADLSVEELAAIKRKLPGGGEKALEVYFRSKIEGKTELP